MVRASPASHGDAPKPRQPGCCWSRFQSFLGELRHLERPAWQLISALAVSEAGLRKLPDNQRARRMAAGDGGCVGTSSPSWPSCPAYVLPLRSPPGAPPGRYSKLQRTRSWASCSRGACLSRCWTQGPPQVLSNVHPPLWDSLLGVLGWVSFAADPPKLLDRSPPQPDRAEKM